MRRNAFGSYVSAGAERAEQAAREAEEALRSFSESMGVSPTDSTLAGNLNAHGAYSSARRRDGSKYSRSGTSGRDDLERYSLRGSRDFSESARSYRSSLSLQSSRDSYPPRRRHRGSRSSEHASASASEIAHKRRRSSLRKVEKALAEDRLSTDRSVVLEAMAVCIENAEASDEIVALLRRSFSHSAENLSAAPSTATEPVVPLEVADLDRDSALLFIISDVLHNCASATTKNSSSYWRLFQDSLGEVFASLGRCHRAALRQLGRISAGKLREDVTRVLRAWEAWSLYPGTFMQGLARIFAEGDSGSFVAMPQSRNTAQQQSALEHIDVDTVSDKRAAGADYSFSSDEFDGEGESSSYDMDIDGDPLFDTTVTRYRKDGTAVVETHRGICGPELLELDLGTLSEMTFEEMQGLCDRNGLPSTVSESDMRHMLQTLTSGSMRTT